MFSLAHVPFVYMVRFMNYTTSSHLGAIRMLLLHFSGLVQQTRIILRTIFVLKQNNTNTQSSTDSYGKFVQYVSVFVRDETDYSIVPCRWGRSGRMRRMIQSDDSTETDVIQGCRSGPKYKAFAFPSAAIMSLIGFLSHPVGLCSRWSHGPRRPAADPARPPRALHTNPAAHHLRDAQFRLF